MKELELSASQVAFGEIHFAMRDEGVRPEIADHLIWHERKHFSQDSERTGNEKIGFILGDGWIMAYYLVCDDRTPETMMAIASAPGYSEMSEADWNIYNSAWRQFLDEESIESRSEASKDNVEAIDPDQVLPEFIHKEKLDNYHLLHPEITNREIIVEFGRRIDELIASGKIPNFQETSRLSLKEYLSEYGDILKQAFDDSIAEMKISKNTEVLAESNNLGVGNTPKEEKIVLKYGEPGWWENLPANLKWLEKYKETGLPFDPIAPILKTLTYEIAKNLLVGLLA